MFSLQHLLLIKRIININKRTKNIDYKKVTTLMDNSLLLSFLTLCIWSEGTLKTYSYQLNRHRSLRDAIVTRARL